ncbi:MAG: hypothetical protein EBT42_06450, partial [Actinobacteria bacterium]|nr:hypothetical protein [Actinomycetota bacterium]
LNQYFTSSVGDEKINVKVQFDEESEEALQYGKEIVKDGGGGCDDNEPEEKIEDELDSQNANISLTKDVLPFILPLSCILTINTEDRDILRLNSLIVQVRN